VKVNATANVDALAQHLRLSIQARGLTLRWVERQLGMGEGYLGQLLRGNLDLKVKHVMAVLQVIGMEPEEFFSTFARGGYPVPLPYPAYQAPAAAPPRFDTGNPPIPRRPGEVVPGLSEERLEQAVTNALLRLGYPPYPEPEQAEEEERDRPAHRQARKRRR
jgi:transcriptional regulator with XRE-family HTH domain